MNEDKQLINIENNPLNVNRYGEYELKYSRNRYTIQDDGVEQYTVLDHIGACFDLSSQFFLSGGDVQVPYLEDQNEISAYLSTYHPDILKKNLEIVSIKGKIYSLSGIVFNVRSLITYIIDRIPYSANPIVNFETISSESETGEIELSNRIEEISYMKIDPEFNNGKIVQNYMKEYEDVEVIATGLSSFNWHQQNKYIENINFGNTVVQIGAEAFKDNLAMSSLTIPSWIKYIGKDAFADTFLTISSVNFVERTFDEVSAMENYPWGLDAKHFTKVTYDNGEVKKIKIAGTISKSLIENIDSVTEIEIGNLVTSIKDRTFFKCSKLTSVTIPDSVTSIGNNAFYNCSNLSSITIPNSVTSIEYGAFYYCSRLTSITIPDSVTSIGHSAFYGCSGLTSITIPDGMTSIEHNAFRSCSNLSSITIPNSVTSIGNYAFNGCSKLSSVTIPDSVTSIGDSAFEGCSGLTSITIPDSVTSIGNYAFHGCSRLTSVTIPDGITDIVNFVFYNCSGLTSITIPDGVTSIGESAFSGCSGLTSITIPDSVTSIGNYAFHGCSRLTSVTIPDSVTSIGNYAFDGCSRLSSVTIPDSVTSIGNKAFYECFNLTLVSLPALFREQINLIGIPSTCEVIFRPLWDECTKSSNWAGTNASTRYMNILSPGLSNSEFKNRVNWIKNTRQCNCAHVFITNKGDGEYAGYSPYGNPSGSGAFGYAVAYTGINKTYTNEMTSRIKYLYEQGLGIVLWLMADDSMDWANDLSRGATMTKYCADIKSLGWFNYASTVVIGLEVEEYWNNETTINTLISTLRKYYTGKIGVHHGSNSYSLGKNADIHFVQLNPGQSNSAIRSYVNTVKNATGKPVNMFELERNPDRTRSQVALDAGAYGVGNW